MAISSHVEHGTVSQDENVSHFFVYGTLRDDDDSGSPWTGPWIANCIAKDGQCSGYKMFQERNLNYPYAVKTDNPNDVLIGRVLTWKDSATILAKLKSADDIEEYEDGNPDSLYQRTVVDINGTPCYLYYQNPSQSVIDRSVAVPNNDWLQRDKSGTSVRHARNSSQEAPIVEKDEKYSSYTSDSCCTML